MLPPDVFDLYLITTMKPIMLFGFYDKILNIEFRLIRKWRSMAISLKPDWLPKRWNGLELMQITIFGKKNAVKVTRASIRITVII